MIHDRTKKVAPPVFPYPTPHPTAENATRRQELAAWITSKDNPYFARSYVNRLWGYLFGVGIIEPLDDLRAGNPATNPELLDYLTEEFLKSGFDARHVIRLICKSRAYQLSVATNEWNEDDKINYSHATARRLPAEVLYDAVNRATGRRLEVPRRAGRHPGGRAARLGGRAAQRLPDHLRPAGPRERLRVRAVQRPPARPGHGPGQRPDDQRRHRRPGQRRRRSWSRPRPTTRSWSTSCSSAS